MAASNFQLGYQSTIEVDASGNDGTFGVGTEALGGWTSGSLTVRRSNVDSTNVDTAGYEGKEYGIQGLSITLECLDDQNTDTAQDTLLNDYTAGTKRWIRVRPHVGTGYLEFEAQFVINNASYTLEQNGIVRFSLGADSHGAFVQQDQT